MEVQIKNNRIRIDGLNQLVLNLEGSAQLTKCSNGLLLAKAWLGKALGELGTDSPIEPAADKFDAVEAPDWGTKHIEKVDWLRQQIEEIYREVLPMDPRGTWGRQYLYINHAHTYLCEARFWLGFELERIRKEE